LNQFASGVFAQQTPAFVKSLQQSIQRNSSTTTTQLGASSVAILEFSQFVASAEGKSASECSILDFDPIELAQQLALRQHTLFALVKPNEWLDSNYRGDEAETKAPNALRFLQCNESIQTMASLELESSSSNGTKMLALEKLALIAEHSIKLNDFQTAAAIANVLEKNLALVEVLYSLVLIQHTFLHNFPHQTMAGKYRHLYGTLSSMIHDENELREKLMIVSPPLVPPMSYLLAEVTKHEVGKDMLTDKLINFEKRRNAGEVLVRLQKSVKKILFTMV